MVDLFRKNSYFHSVFQNPSPTISQQVEGTASEIERFETLIKSAKDLLLNDKNLSSECRQKLTLSIVNATEKLEQTRARFENIVNRL